MLISSDFVDVIYRFWIYVQNKITNILTVATLTVVGNNTQQEPNVSSQQLTQKLTITINATTHPTKQNHQSAILFAIDEALPQNAKYAIYHHLKTNFGIEKAQIPLQVEAFADALQQVFGDGAKLIEIYAIRKLSVCFSGFSYKPKTDDFVFSEYVLALIKYAEQLDHC